MPLDRRVSENFFYSMVPLSKTGNVIGRKIAVTVPVTIRLVQAASHDISISFSFPRLPVMI